MHHLNRICYSSEKMKTTAAHTTPPAGLSGYDADNRPSLLAAASNLVWQLAVVVILPIFGGAKLDDLFGTGSVLTVIGFAIAAIGMSYIVYRQMKLLTPTIDAVDTSAGTKEPKA